MLPTIDQGNLVISTFDFLPELVLALGIVALLLVRLCRSFDRVHLGGLASLIVLIALGLSLLQWLGGAGLRDLLQTFGTAPGSELSAWVGQRSLSSPQLSTATLLYGSGEGGMLVYDYFTVYFRVFLCTFALLVIWLTGLTGIPDREDSADFYCLLLGATLGMSLMASAAHLLMVFIAIEMASLPGYALAGFLKGRRASSEAALKYVVYGGGSAGIMLYGISLLAALRHRLSAGRRRRPGRQLSPRRRRHRLRPADRPRRALLPGRHRLQARCRAVPFLVPRRLRGGQRRGGRLPVGRLQGGGPGPARPLHHAARRTRSAHQRCRRRHGPALPGAGALPGPYPGLFRRIDRHLREPGGVSSDQPQTPAGLLHHRPRRLHAHGPVYPYPAGRRGGAVLPGRLPGHEPGRLCRRRLPAQPDT